ncbi:MAG: C_GCAxxG_C_C family protein [Armatimonadetes bacterium]|jgi:C_GCAxxG_C_C family probable redox protein|nr:C_GCAxxG_C_C family protein [Armatimonadota bacterium]
MTKRSAKEIAIDYFAQKYSCAESVLLGLLEAHEIDCPVAPRIATGFGGGFGSFGEVCGAISGAVMALGLQFGRDTLDVEQKAICYNKVRFLMDMFENEFGTVLCAQLTGCEMRTDEGKARAKELNLHNTLCPKFVAFAAECASELIK